MAISGTSSTTDLLIAPCGLDCRLCRAHQRAKNPCPGCRAPDDAKPKTRVICRIKTCEKRAAQKIEFCGDCEDFPCADVIHLDKRYRAKYRVSVAQNLVNIRELGAEGFVAIENRKWTCPGCGSMLCVHEPRCPACGLAWQR